MWYVIQVINGREDVMRERIEHVVPAGAMQELFYPQFQTEIKVHGEWVNTTKVALQRPPQKKLNKGLQFDFDRAIIIYQTRPYSSAG